MYIICKSTFTYIPAHLLRHEAKLGVGHEVLGAEVDAPASNYVEVERLLDLLFQVVLNPGPAGWRHQGE